MLMDLWHFLWVLANAMFTTHFPGNGKHSTYKNGDECGMVYYCFTHIIGHGLIGRETSQPVFDEMG